VTQKVLDEDLFSDGVDVSEIAAYLEAVLLRGVVRRCSVKDAVARSVDAATSKPSPL